MPKTNRRRPKLLIIVPTVVIATIVIFTLEITDTTHWFHKSPVVRAPSAPITKLAQQPSSSTKTPTSGSGTEQGSATDKKGQAPTNTPSDSTQWSTSESGVITVKLPANKGTFKSGGTVTGSARIIDNVQYRLLDDSVGVIAQGPIQVVNGNFTASISFTPHSSTGRLDVFSTESSGREINEVQLQVKF
ncbi:MAG TPA: hypothetical protein VK534_00840 [Methylomirabilota bacterium]|nr:hypothetical protein [Methylomirabilota bacterium]